MAEKVPFAKKIGDLPLNRRLAAVMADITTSTKADRDVAIIGTAFLDLVLREAITVRLRDHDEDQIKRVFEGGGPLRSFSARIERGYALGIYAGGVYADLNTIREIRNAFAHAAEDINFETTDIGRMTDALNLLKIRFAGRARPAT